MSNRKKSLLNHWPQLLVIGILNCLIVLEPLLFSTKAAMLDANAHIVTGSQFYKALSDGEFPVMWADRFANYGLPLGTISHQIPSYLGGLLTFITHNPLISYYLLILIALVSSAIGTYLFLTRSVSSEAAFLATTLYSFATYRITNIYVRGAMPELFMTLWVPYILIVLTKISGTRTYLVLTALLALLILTHPMSLILHVPFIFLIALIMFSRNFVRIGGVCISISAAIALSAYYLLPLRLESKYLYMGSNSNLLVYNQSVDWSAIAHPALRYTCVELNYIFWRCADISFGTLEVVLVILGLGVATYLFVRSRYLPTSSQLGGFLAFFRQTDLGKRIFVSSLVCMFIAFLLSSSLTEYLYARISLLGSIQIPSRFLSVFYFFFAVVFAFSYDPISRHKVLSILVWFTVLFLIVTLQFPQIYGKNYTNIPLGNFYFSRENYHGLMVQPKWTIDSTEYPVAPEKAQILSGKGTIQKRILKNASRIYTIRAETEVLVNDHTFYFPGWNVYIDDQPAAIEFQDHAYRGVITFKVPPGQHEVKVVYEDTKVRRLGKYISFASLIGFIAVAIILKRRDDAKE